MRQIFVAILSIALLAVAFIQGCENPPPRSGQQSSASKAPSSERDNSSILDGVRVEPIPLDDAPPDSASDTAMNIYFIFDGSGSMKGTKLAEAKRAVETFIQKVPPEVNIGLYVFDGRGAREVVALGRDNRSAFLNAVNAIQASGGTPLTEAIETGIDKLIAQYKRQLGYGEYRVVVVTDGEATGRNIEDAVIYATRYGIPLYTIGLHIERDHSLRQYSVSYRSANSEADLAAGLEATLGETEIFDVTEFEAEESTR